MTSTPLDGIGWPHHFDTQDSEFGSQGSEFGSQGSEFGSQGGSQGGSKGVVEEWLKEDEHTRWCEKERKVWDTPEMACEEKIDK